MGGPPFDARTGSAHSRAVPRALARTRQIAVIFGHSLAGSPGAVLGYPQNGAMRLSAEARRSGRVRGELQWTSAGVGPSVILRGGPRLSGGARSAVGHPVPGQEFAEPGLRRVGDLGKSVGEPSLRIDLVELCGLNQRVHDRGALSPAL